MPSPALLTLVLPLLGVACSATEPAQTAPSIAARFDDEPVVQALTRTSARVPLHLLTDGAEALAAGLPGEALVLLERYLEAEPESTMALFLHGVALLDLGRLHESRASLTRLEQLDPDDAASLGVLARVHYDLGDLEAAIGTLERATQVEPDMARHWTSLGLMHFENDDWEGAYDSFLEAVRLDPGEAEAHHGLGRLYTAVGENEAAERAFRSALEVWPDDPGLMVALGHTLRDLDRGAEAVVLYRRASAYDTHNPWIAANLGSVLLELERHHEARPYFEQALLDLSDDGPDHALVLLNYGMLLEAVGDLDAAEASWEEVLEVEPELTRAHALLGLLLDARGQDDRAVEHLEAAFASMSLSPEAMVRLVLLHERRGDWGLALSRARPLLEVESDAPELVLGRAQLSMRSRHPRLRDPSRAVQLAEEVVSGRLGDRAESWMLLSEAHEKAGQLRAAVSTLDRALDRFGNGPWTAQWRARRDRLQAELAER